MCNRTVTITENAVRAVHSRAIADLYQNRTFWFDSAVNNYDPNQKMEQSDLGLKCFLGLPVKVLRNSKVPLNLYFFVFYRWKKKKKKQQ